jgi:serine/threonine protein kinase
MVPSSMSSMRLSPSLYRASQAFKRGARLHRWTSRWVVYRQRVLYIFKRPTDVVPSRAHFLEGAFVESDETAVSSGHFGVTLTFDELYKEVSFALEPSTSTTPSTSSRLSTSSTRRASATPTSITHKLFFRDRANRNEWLLLLKAASQSRVFSDKYEFGRTLGAGRFSTVKAATSRVDGCEYAVKVIDKRAIAGDMVEREALRTEIAILKLVQHPAVVEMKESFESRDNLYVVMRLARGGDLFEYMLKRGRVGEADARVIMYKLFAALCYLHARGIVHRDLKPENILCYDGKTHSDRSDDDAQMQKSRGADDDDGESDDDDESAKPTRDIDVMIADFGLSKFSSPSEVMNVPCGTLAYVAPEVLRLLGYSSSVDVWSLGVIAYALVRAKLPFTGDTKEAVIDATLHGKVGSPHHSRFDVFVVLLSRVLIVLSNERIVFTCQLLCI